MQLNAQKYIELCEAANRIAFVDSEFSNLKADFGTLICTSIKPLKGPTVTFCVKKLGSDKEVVKQTMRELEKYNLLVTFFGARCDIPYLRSRALRHGLPDIPQIAHCDIYWSIRYATVLSRRNQGHLVDWLELPDSAEKMKVSPNTWAELAANQSKYLHTLRKRCESDCDGLAALWHRSKHLVKAIGSTR